MTRKNQAHLLIIFLTFLILAILVQYGYTEVASQSSQQTGGQTGFWGIIGPIIAAIIIAGGAIIAAYIGFRGSRYVKKDDFDALLKNSIRALIKDPDISKDILDIIIFRLTLMAEEDRKNYFSWLTTPLQDQIKDIQKIMEQFKPT